MTAAEAWKARFHELKRDDDRLGTDYARALLALAAWRRFAQHAEQRQWIIPLWGALLWDRAIAATDKALGDDRG